jgi:hypothetical protein
MGDTMHLRSLGIAGIDGVVAVWQTDPAHGQKHIEASLTDFEDWKAQSATRSS